MGDACRQFCRETDLALGQLRNAIYDRTGLEKDLDWDLFFVLKDLRHAVTRLQTELWWWQREVEALADDKAFARLAERVRAYDYVRPLFPGEALSTGALPTLRHIGDVLARAVEARRAPGRDDFCPTQGGSWELPRHRA